MIPGPLLTEMLIFSQRGFGSLKTKILAPAPERQVESTVTIIPPHVFSQNYLFAPNVYLPTIIWIYM